MVLRPVLLIAALLMCGAVGTAAQPGVKAADAWVAAADGPETAAYVTVQNGTMYDVYLTGAETAVAQAVELMQTANGKAGAVKEVSIPAFDRVAMAADAVILRLKGLKKPLQAGDRVALVLGLDNGDRLNVEATVK